MDTKALIRQMLAQRERWVNLDETHAVKVRRPAEAEMPAFFKSTGVEAACTHVVDWRGFTEADLLGASVGSSDALTFDADLWRHVVSDRLEWAGIVAEEISEEAQRHILARKEAEKN